MLYSLSHMPQLLFIVVTFESDMYVQIGVKLCTEIVEVGSWLVDQYSPLFTVCVYMYMYTCVY